MAVIPLPTRMGFSQIETFKLQRQSIQVRSKFTAVRQALVFPYAIWQMEATLVELDGVDAARMRSFLVQLDGVQNKFRLPVPGYYHPASGYAGDGKVGARVDSRAQSVVVNGLTPNTNIIGEGEYFNIGEELKMSTSAVRSDNTGKATFTFKSALRSETIAIGSVVKLQNPYCLMHAMDDDVATWSIRPPTRQAGKFRAIEAIELGAI